MRLTNMIHLLHGLGPGGGYLAGEGVDQDGLETDDDSALVHKFESVERLEQVAHILYSELLPARPLTLARMHLKIEQRLDKTQSFAILGLTTRAAACISPLPCRLHLCLIKTYLHKVVLSQQATIFISPHYRAQSLI